MANSKERKRSHKKTPNQSVSSAQSQSENPPPPKKKSPKPTPPSSRSKKPVADGSVSKPAVYTHSNVRRQDRERRPSPSVSRGSVAASMKVTPEPSLQPCQISQVVQPSPPQSSNAHSNSPHAGEGDTKKPPPTRQRKNRNQNQTNGETSTPERPSKLQPSRTTAVTTTELPTPSSDTPVECSTPSSMTSTPSAASSSPMKSALHNELQTIYHRVCHIEDQCGRLMQKLAQEKPLSYDEAGDSSRITEGGKSAEIRAERLNKLLAEATKRHAALLDAHYDFLRVAHYNDSASIRGLVNKYDIPSRLWSRGVYAFVHVARNLLPYASRYLSDHLRHCAQILLLLAEPYFDREADGKNLPTWTEAVGDLARIGMSIRTDDAIYWRGVAHWWYSRALQTSCDNGRPHHHYALVLACRLESLLSLCRATLCETPFAPAANTMDALFGAGAAKMQRQGEREPLEAVVDSFISIHEGTTQGRFPDVRQKLMSLGAVIARTPHPFLASRAAIFAAINIAGLHEYGRGALVSVWKDKNDVDTVRIPGSHKYVAFHVLRAHLALSPDKALPHLIPWILFMLALSRYPRVFLDVFDHRFPWKDMLWYLNEIKVTIRPHRATSDNQSRHSLWNPPSAKESPPIPHGYVSKLPEEALLQGFAWAKDILSSPIDDDTLDIVNTMSLAGQLDYTIGEHTRLERAQDLIKQLGETCLFHLDDNGIRQDPEMISHLAQKRDTPDYIAEYETFHEFLPDIGDNAQSCDTVHSLCKKRDLVRQECGVQSKIENLELTTSPLAGDRKPVIVFDTNLWLSELEFVMSVVEGGWLRLKVPVFVTYELRKLQTFDRDVYKSGHAEKALSYIENKWQNGSEIVVIGLTGSALTKAEYSETLARIADDYGGPLRRSGLPSMDELITRTVSKLQKRNRSSLVRALLVTDDKNMRIIALTQSVPVASGPEFITMYREESGGRRNETPGIRSMRSRKSELSV